MFKNLKLAALALLLSAGAGFAASTINPTQPAANSPMSSVPMRANFQAAYNDVNNLLTKFASTFAPIAPSTYQYWFDTSTNPHPLKIYDGSVWVSTGTLDPTTHTWVAGSLAIPVTVPQGGTGLTAGTSGGIPYYASSTTMASSAALAANRLVLGGGAGVAPATLGSLGTTTTVLHGNAAGAPTYAAVSLTADVSGILPGANGGTANGFFAVSGPTTSLKTFALPDASTTILTTNSAVTVAQGGTGVATLTNHGVLLGQGTANVVATSVGTSGQLLTGATGADPTFRTMTGDVTVTSTLVSAIKSSVALAGSPTTTTQTTGDNSTKIATTAYVDGSISAATAVSTRQVLISGTTYTRPTSPTPRQLKIRMCGGGGGGAANSNDTGNGGAGGATSFNSVTAGGGSGGLANGNAGIGGTGGTGAPTGVFRVKGGGGGAGMTVAVTVITANNGGIGGSGAFGGGAAANAGTAAAANTCGGGAGNGLSGITGTSGGGGGAGEYVDFLINTPTTSYTYAIGAAGTAGANAGTGGSGLIIVDEYY